MNLLKMIDQKRQIVRTNFLFYQRMVISIMQFIFEYKINFTRIKYSKFKSQIAMENLC